MAQEQEDDIIILEEGDEQEEPFKEEMIEQEGSSSKKKLYIIIALAIVFLILIAIILLFAFRKNTQEKGVVSVTKIAKEIIKKEPASKFPPLKIDKIIKKANLLYKQGDKKEALKLYKEVASFNESISNYNIGVVKMRERRYKEAIEYFKKAIKNRQNRCVSSINAAVCALKLNDKELFKYYINLADVYLPYESEAPLYSYYMALIKYYKNEYFEALFPLRHRSSKYYNNEQNYLASKIDTFFGDDISAIGYLENSKDIRDNFTLGLLYAKIGHYHIAIKHFLKSLKMNIKPVKTRVAMALSYVQLGLLKSANINFRSAKNMSKKNICSIYPLKVILKNSENNIFETQKEFEKSIFSKKENKYGLLFYFAPYKIFDTKQTIEFIRKGGLSLSLNETKNALLLLSQSSKISKVNKMIALGIKKALEYKTNEANKIFSSLTSQYPNHAILFYDLGLSYAQMGDYTQAYKNFVKSYHLNSNNYLAGVFAVITKDLMYQDFEKLLQEIESDLQNDHKIKDKKFYSALLDFVRGNIVSAANYCENENIASPLHLIFDLLVAKDIDNKEMFYQKASLLRSKLPKDMVAELMYDYAKSYGKKPQEFAKAIQSSFLKRDTDLKPLFYGPIVAREIYIDALRISGMLYYVRDILEKQLEKENDDIAGVMQALGYVDIFAKKYEEAYALYNELIDTYKQKDTNTLFLASVASIGAGHNANAIALLELAKLTDPNNFESRFALGLLYLEVKNIDAAMIQFGKIGDINFRSKYFTFKIAKDIK